MSKSKKTTTRKKTSVPTRRSYDLDTILGGRGGLGRGGNDLDRILKDHQRMQAQKVKSLQVEKIGLEMQRDVDKLKREVGTGSPQGAATLSADEIKTLATLPEDQQAKAIQAITAFKSMQGGSAAVGNPLSMMLMSQMLTQKPQTSMTELVGALKGLNDIAESGRQKPGDMNTLLQIATIIGSAKDGAYASQIELMRQQIKEVTPMTPTDYAKTIGEAANALGFTRQGATPNIDMRKMELMHDKEISEANRQHELLLRKMERDDARTLELIKVLGPAVQNLSGAGASRLTGVRAGNAKQAICPNCSYSPVWLTDDAPAACPKCSQQVVTEAYQQKAARAQADQQKMQSEQEQREANVPTSPSAYGDVTV